MVGDARSIFLPDFKRVRAGKGRLRGLRCVHTHLRNEPLSQEDLTDLALLRLDLMVAIGSDAEGLPTKAYTAHLLPRNEEGRSWAELKPVHPSLLDTNFSELVESLEVEFRRTRPAERVRSEDRAILVFPFSPDEKNEEAAVQELKELARSSGLTVLDTARQRRRRPDPKFVIGRGVLADLVIRGLQLDANLLVFGRDLTPAQAYAISEYADMRVIDRTQLILDIFALQAKSADGRLQVELAQLRYALPRLKTKQESLSRLTGGIGGRGPGETTLEINRRRVRDRIGRLEREIKKLSRQRGQRRAERRRSGIPVISIIGYTNAGKSTLLNSLTHSSFRVENRLFATLDPASRRLRFPREREVIITDTVGFIRDLPKDLVAAFKATLEELSDANLLLHVIDASSPYFEQHVESVEKILSDLGLDTIPRLPVFNKSDKVAASLAAGVAQRHRGVAVSALEPETLRPLLAAIEIQLWKGEPRAATERRVS